MAQVTSVPVPQLHARQVDLGSLLSAGLGVLSSILTPTPTQTTNADPVSTSADPSGLDSIFTTPSTASTASDSSTFATSTSSLSSSDPTSTSAASSSDPSTTSSLSSSSSSLSSTAAAASESATSAASHSNHKNNTLPIVLGVVLGVLAVALLAFLLCCCLRRRRKRGSMFGRRSPTISDTDSYMAIGDGVPKHHSDATSHTAVEGAALRDSPPSMREHQRDSGSYPPIPAPHQISSLNRHHNTEYAYIPNDPFEDGSRAMFEHDRDARSRSRHSAPLNPVREMPSREHSWERRSSYQGNGTRHNNGHPAYHNVHERSNSDPRSQGHHHRWSGGSGMSGATHGHPHHRSITRKPVPGSNGSSPQHGNGGGPFEFFPHNGGTQHGPPRNRTNSGVANGGFSDHLSRGRPPAVGERYYASHAY